MKIFNAHLAKEFFEGIKTFKFLIIGISFLIFAIMEPIMYKLLPYMLEGEGIDPALLEMMDTTQQGLLRNYMGSLTQIGMIIVTLGLMSIMANEIQKKQLILPISKGVKIKNVVLSKFLLYSIVLCLVINICFMVNVFYTGILFGTSDLAIAEILMSGSLFSLYFIFALSLLIFLISLTKKGVAGAIATLVITFILIPLLANFSDLVKFLPQNLISQAGLFELSMSNDLFITLISTVVMIGLFVFGTIKRVENMEIA
ncbi:hypothetical protein RH915_07205 [Serpentinicella sp. ANB-PHB4]|uniref:hypothetical protein n=1 Tax=Serpentinicella sp. ANB-PHB4 TaxID=3074076 RepID=UPI002855C177|nr:hypothetical protein [Serpentinicella sp. ANB-PHB4]MDR5659273.1 hypothetical protein [Serpentinicella sp. ANB-PHB4]